MNAKQLKNIVNAINDDVWVDFRVGNLKDILKEAQAHLDIGNEDLPIKLSEFEIHDIGEGEDEIAVLIFKTN